MQETPRRPLLVIDGNSFAHRSYHAVPKTIRRAGDRGGGAIVGFANYLIRLHEAERPRAVLVGWDTLETPNWRQRAFTAYQGGRAFDAELVEQLGVLPEFVASIGFANAKAGGYEADDSSPRPSRRKRSSGGTAVVATGDRDAFQLASNSTVILQPIRAGEMVRIGPAEVRERYGVEPGPGARFHRAPRRPLRQIPGAPASVRRPRRARSEVRHARGRARRRPLRLQAEELRLYRRLATMDRSAAAAIARPGAELGVGRQPRRRMGVERAGRERLAGLAKTAPG